MKGLGWLGGVLVAIVVLAGCASLPRPESDDNALVVGYLVLDFPDGFFADRARKVSDGVQVSFINTTQQREFTVRTIDGYFCFLSNGSDDYVMKTYKYETRSNSGGSATVGGGEIMREISTKPGKVVYLGHITVTYGSPKRTKSLGGDAQSFWSFDIRADSRWDLDGLHQYLVRRDSKGDWLEREVVKP
jgi:hypothetical protein